MSYYANSGERGRFIAGLRDLANYLDANPAIPSPRDITVHVFPPDGSNAEMLAEIDAIAGRIGATPNNDSPRGHYCAIRDFGPVQYRAVAIPRNDDGNGQP